MAGKESKIVTQTRQAMPTLVEALQVMNDAIPNPPANADKTRLFEAWGKALLAHSVEV